VNWDQRKALMAIKKSIRIATQNAVPAMECGFDFLVRTKDRMEVRSDDPFQIAQKNQWRKR